MHLAKQSQISAALLVGLIFGGADLDHNKVVAPPRAASGGIWKKHL